MRRPASSNWRIYRHIVGSGVPIGSSAVLNASCRGRELRPSHALITVPKIISKRVKHAKTPRFFGDVSHLHSPQATSSSPRRFTQPHWGPLFFQRATMLAAKRRNRHSWFSSRAKKTPEMDNEQATFWLSQFIGKNLRIHASDGRVFGGQMKCTDKVSS